MSDAGFELVFRGKLLKDFDRATVLSNLAQLFKQDPQRIAPMLDQPKWVIKRGLSREAGQKYQEVLRQAGMMVTLVPMELGTGTGSELASVTPTPSSGVGATNTMPPAVANAPIAPVVAVGGETRAPAATVSPASSVDAGLLAPVGAELLPGYKPVPAPSFDLSAYQLAAVGVDLVDRKPTAPAQIDTSRLSLAPMEAMQHTPDPAAVAMAKLLAE